MPIKLTTGQKISLRKEAPGLSTLLFSLGWDRVERKGLRKLFQSDFDLDSSVLCLDSDKKLRKSTDVIYYGNSQHPSEAISHLGDELTGEGKGNKAKVLIQNERERKGDEDKEQVLINLSQIPPHIANLVFFVNIYECYHRRQNFGQLSNAYVELVDLEEETVIARYELSHEDYQTHTGILVAEVYREDDKWEIEIVGEGVRVGSLEEFVRRYS